MQLLTIGKEMVFFVIEYIWFLKMNEYKILVNIAFIWYYLNVNIFLNKRRHNYVTKRI